MPEPGTFPQGVDAVYVCGGERLTARARGCRYATAAGRERGVPVACVIRLNYNEADLFWREMWRLVVAKRPSQAFERVMSCTSTSICRSGGDGVA